MEAVIIIVWRPLKGWPTRPAINRAIDHLWEKVFGKTREELWAA